MQVLQISDSLVARSEAVLPLHSSFAVDSPWSCRRPCLDAESPSDDTLFKALALGLGNVAIPSRIGTKMNYWGITHGILPGNAISWVKLEIHVCFVLPDKRSLGLIRR